MLGKEVLQQEFYSVDKIEFTINQSPGVYFIELLAGKGSAATIKII